MGFVIGNFDFRLEHLKRFRMHWLFLDFKMIELLPVNESDSRCSIVQSNNGLVYPGMILARFRTHAVIYVYIYICMYIPYTCSVIGRIYNGSVIQYWRSCTPSRSIGECAVPFFLWFTNCVLLFDKNLILGCLWLLVFVLNNILILGIWCSTIPHLPGCFCPWTFFENIGFNTVLTDPFMSHLATQLGYSAGEFQALQLIVLAVFGVVD